MEQQRVWITRTCYCLMLLTVAGVLFARYPRHKTISSTPTASAEVSENNRPEAYDTPNREVVHSQGFAPLSAEKPIASPTPSPEQLANKHGVSFVNGLKFGLSVSESTSNTGAQR